MIRGANAGFGDGGDAKFQHGFAAGGNHVSDVSHCLGRDVIHDQGAGGFLQQPNRSAGAVRRGGPACWRLDVMAVGEAGNFQRRRVRHAHVARIVHEIDGTAVADGIELFGRWMPAQIILVVAGADDPLALRRRGGAGVHRRLKLRHAIDDAGAKVNLGGRLTYV